MYFQVASQAFSFIVSFIYLFFLAQKLNMHDLNSLLALSSFKLKKKKGILERLPEAGFLRISGLSFLFEQSNGGGWRGPELPSHKSLAQD